MVLPWYNGVDYGSIAENHESAMSMMVYYNGTTVVEPWHYHGTSMVLPWHYHGTTVVLPWYNGVDYDSIAENHESTMEYDCTTMLLPW